MKTYTFEAPAHWASALINGDLTGLDYYGPEAVKEFEDWCKENPKEQSEVVSADGESYIGRWNGLQTEMLEYQALSHQVTE